MKCLSEGSDARWTLWEVLIDSRNDPNMKKPEYSAHKRGFSSAISTLWYPRELKLSRTPQNLIHSKDFKLKSLGARDLFLLCYCTFFGATAVLKNKTQVSDKWGKSACPTPSSFL